MICNHSKQTVIICALLAVLFLLSSCAPAGPAPTSSASTAQQDAITRQIESSLQKQPTPQQTDTWETDREGLAETAGTAGAAETAEHETAASEPAAPTESPNTVHPIEEEHVILNQEQFGGYVDNIMVIFVREGVDDATVLSWFPGENASIAGRFPGIRQLQIRIKPRTRSELESLANQLMEKEQVLYAHLELAGSTAGQNIQAKQSPDTSAAADQSALPESPDPDPYAQPSEDDPPYDPPSAVKPVNEWWYDVIGLQAAQKHLPAADLVKVGVVDDGFDTTHPDLKLIFPGQEIAKLNSPEEHGTHVAGIIQQILPHSTITAVDSYRIPDLEPHGHLATQCQFMHYLVELVEKEVRVINYSMGSNLTDEQVLAWNVEFSAIASVYIWQLKQLGHDFLLVQSAGNSEIDTYLNGIFCTLNADNCLGSAQVRSALGISGQIAEAQQSVFDSIVIVGSCDRKDASGVYHLSSGTNYGETITVLAPGVDINSTVPGGYQSLGGTSQAAPIVSGSLGFLWSLDRKLTSAQLKQILIDTAVDQAVDPGRNNQDRTREKYPILNLDAAVKRVLKLK